MKIGDYVRTKKGIKRIYIIDNIKTKWKYLFKLKEQDGDGCIDLGYLCDDDIIGEPKEKLIDLIQVGDYVNGLPVRFVEENRVDIGQAEDFLWLKNEHITSILTKEQFESMEYKVGEDNE